MCYHGSNATAWSMGMRLIDDHKVAAALRQVEAENHRAFRPGLWADLPADPIHGVLPDPGAPDDHEPLPDGMQQETDFLYAVTVLQAFLWGRPGVLVSGDTPVYYLDAEGIQQIVRPDCYVSFGINPISIRRRNGYFIREVGKPPDFVLEIASESTHANDTGFKRELYARLGVAEYWRFDASGGDLYPEALAGERLVDGEYVRIETVRDTDGVVRGHSEWLGVGPVLEQRRTAVLQSGNGGVPSEHTGGGSRPSGSRNPRRGCGGAGTAT